MSIRYNEEPQTPPKDYSGDPATDAGPQFLIGSQRAAPKSIAAINAEVNQTIRTLEDADPS